MKYPSNDLVTFENKLMKVIISVLFMACLGLGLYAYHSDRSHLDFRIQKLENK